MKMNDSVLFRQTHAVQSAAQNSHDKYPITDFCNEAIHAIRAAG